MNILIVEDEVEEAGVLARVCKREGHEVDIAHTALEAVELMRHKSYSLGLIDYELGGILNGADVGRHAPRGMALIMITGHVVDVIRGRIENPLQPFLEIIGKPFSNERLKRELERVERMREDTKP